MFALRVLGSQYLTEEFAETERKVLLITSGTISPLTSIIKELDIPFSEILQNGHVIKPSQMLVQVRGF